MGHRLRANNTELALLKRVSHKVIRYPSRASKLREPSVTIGLVWKFSDANSGKLPQFSYVFLRVNKRRFN